MSDWRDSDPMKDVDMAMRRVAVTATPPLFDRTGIMRMTGATLDQLRSDMKTAGSDLSPEEAVDLIAKAHGFKEGRIELIEPRGRRGQGSLRLVD